MALAAADRDDLFRIIPIDAFNPYRVAAQYLSREGTGEVRLQHTQKPHPLFRFAVRIDNRFLDERLEPLFAESRTSGHVLRYVG